MRKVRAQTSKRRIALQSFFADFDRLHCGRITAAQFARVLNSNDMQLSEDELQTLVHAFEPVAATSSIAAAADTLAAPGNPWVMYNAFLEALQAAPGSTAAVRRSVASAALTDAEEARLAPVRRMLQQAIQAHGTSLVSPFRDLDPLHTGRVTTGQFCRCLPFSASLSADAMTLFAKQFSDGHGGVYYMPWCRTMDPSLREKAEDAAPPNPHDDCSGINSSGRSMTGAAKARSTTAAASPDASRDSFFRSTTSGLARETFANPDLSAKELVAIFQQQCALYRIRYEDALHDMDKMKTGRVTASQFESALGRMPLVHFALRHDNVETLARFYSNGYTGPLEDCMVDYRSFLRDIHPSQAVQSTADGREALTNFSAATHAADTYLTSAEDHERAAALLDRLRSNIRANRISLSPVLRDFDRVRKGIYEHRTCTHTRFARGLSTQNILLSPEELQLLIRKYTVPNPDGSPSSEVNYYLFVQDVDPSQVSVGTVKPAAGPRRSDQNASATPNNAVAAEAPAKNAVSKEDALQRVARQVIARRLHLDTFLDDADPMHNGALARSRLGAALSQAGVELSAQETAALETAFPSARVRGAVDSVQFQAAVQATVLTLQEQQQQSQGVAGAIRRPAASQTACASPEMVQQLLRRVQRNVQVHNALLMPFFADFDRNHRGIITPTQFAQACVRHHLPLSAEEMTCLADVYRTDATHADEVHYLNFIRDVGCAEEEQNGSNAAHVASNKESCGGEAGTMVEAQSTAGGVAASSVGTASPVTMVSSVAAASAVAAADVDELLTKLCLFLQERRPRLQEFFPDGDELRHQHVTKSRFRHCLSMLGMTALTEQELCTLEGAFPSAKCPGEVDYPAFVCTLRGMLADGVGVAAVTQRRRGSTNNSRRCGGSGTSNGLPNSAAAAFAQETLQRVQRVLRSRRTATITAFREYDRTRKGFVTDGQFFACLQALGVPLQPDEALALLQLYGVGEGQVHYLPFAQEVDDATFISVS